MLNSWTERIGLALLLAFTAGFFVAFGVSPARAEIYIDVQGSEGNFPLAVPDLKVLGKKHDSAEAMLSTLRKDLLISGWFHMQDPASFLENPQKTGLRVDEFSFDDWHTINTAGLVKAGYEVDGQTLKVEVRIYHVIEQKMILGDVISGTIDDPESLAHRVADTVIEAFTGEPGPFSSRIACVTTLSGNKEIALVDLAGRVNTLTRNGEINLSPAYHPDGTKVAYTSIKAGNWDLYVLDIATKQETKVSSHPGINSGADFSPDGSHIALTLSYVGDSEIYAISATDGSNATRLTSSWGIDVSPDWSPDGTKIAFTSGRQGGPQIFVMDRSGGRVAQLTFGGNHNVSPVWSPDGNKIAFAGRDKGRFDIFVCDADGSNMRRLTQSPGDDEDPTWSPDGRYIIFSSDRDGGAKQLYMMTSDGRSITRITDGKGTFTNPDWSPAISR